jgi:hypothetical protein
MLSIIEKEEEDFDCGVVEGLPDTWARLNSCRLPIKRQNKNKTNQGLHLALFRMEVHSHFAHFHFV